MKIDLTTTDDSRVIEVETYFRNGYYTTVLRMIEVGYIFRHYMPTHNKYITIDTGTRLSQKKLESCFQQTFKMTEFGQKIKSLLKEYNLSLTQESIDKLQSIGYV